VMTRRELIFSGAALSLLPGFAFGSLTNAPCGASRILYDSSESHSLAFAQHIASESRPLLVDIEGNVAAYWSSELYHFWRAGPVAISGLTKHSAWFLLDLMARDAGLRTVFRADHLTLPGGGFEHRLYGAYPEGAVRGLLRTPAADWEGVMARLLPRLPAQGPSPGALPVRVARESTLQPSSLVSWVIAAPRSDQI
jgi:hypothetical protein